MNRHTLALSLFLQLPVFLQAQSNDTIADAIYQIEGGARARVPYGILSVKVRDKAHARRLCIQTIENNRKRWEKAGKPGEYLDFLADRYCPPSADAVGNRNWKRNIRKELAK